jgi:predicted PurR-regulated permease PerM
MLGRDKKVTELTISNRTIIRIIVFVISAGLLIRFFENIQHPLTLIFVSFFLCLALNPAVSWVSKGLKNKSRTRATLIAYVGVITVLIGFFSIIVPPLAHQTTDFVSEVPSILRELENDEGTVGEFVRRYKLQEQIVDFANNWSSDFGNVSDQAVSTANRVVSNLISIITVLILTFMMLVEGPAWLKTFWSLYPLKRRTHGKILANKMYKVVTGFVNGQMLVAALGAICAVIALLIMTSIFDVEGINILAFGGIVFLFSLIPTIGVIISTAIVVLFSLFASVPLAIAMLVYFIVYQQIENASIQPLIQSRANELTPLIVFLAVILGIGFGGILGGIVAIPIAGCAKVLFDDYVDRGKLVKED